jgi:hypothetical protein
MDSFDKMATGQTSVQAADQVSINSETLNYTKSKSKSLGMEDRLIKKDDGQLLWVGDFEELKRFSKEVLHLPAKWTSLGGDAKLYSDEQPHA